MNYDEWRADILMQCGVSPDEFEELVEERALRNAAAKIRNDGRDALYADGSNVWCDLTRAGFGYAADLIDPDKP